MSKLGKYHAQGIHGWDGGQCSFHVENLQSVGKPYKSKFLLSCELHLEYEIECERRALNADCYSSCKGRHTRSNFQATMLKSTKVA